MNPIYITLTQYGTVHHINHTIDANQITHMEALTSESTRIELSYGETVVVAETPSQIKAITNRAYHYA